MSDQEFQSLDEQIKAFDPRNPKHLEWLAEKKKRNLAVINAKARRMIQQLEAGK